MERADSTAEAVVRSAMVSFGRSFRFKRGGLADGAGADAVVEVAGMEPSGSTPSDSGRMAAIARVWL